MKDDTLRAVPSGRLETGDAGSTHNRLLPDGPDMVRASSLVMLAGVGLLFVPIPPIATVLGIVVILIGVALRVLTDN